MRTSGRNQFRSSLALWRAIYCSWIVTVRRVRRFCKRDWRSLGLRSVRVALVLAKQARRTARRQTRAARVFFVAVKMGPAQFAANAKAVSLRHHYKPLGGSALVCVGLIAAVVSVGIGAESGMQRIELAKPALESKTRVVEVAQFAVKLESAFKIPSNTAAEFSDWLIEAASRQRINADILASVVITESSFRKHVRSAVGAIGPAQVRPGYWSEFCGRSDLTDPENNVYCGAQVLGHLLDRCGQEYVCALGAYNVGLNSNRRAAALRYVAKVDRHLDMLREDTL